MKRPQRSKLAASCSSSLTSLLRMKATMRKTPSTKKTRLAMVLTILMMQKWGRSPGSCRILPSSMKKLFKLGLICSRSITTSKDYIWIIFIYFKSISHLTSIYLSGRCQEYLGILPSSLKRAAVLVEPAIPVTVFSLIDCIVDAGVFTPRYAEEL